MAPLPSPSLAAGGTNRRWSAAFLAGNIVATLLFVIWAWSRLVEGHDWGDDFGLYLQLAKNIRAGQPYNHLNTMIQVPPGFPAILAGWEDLFGQSFVALKCLNIASWVVAAWIAYCLADKLLGRAAATAVLIAHFLVPSYYYSQQDVLSDLPFLALTNLLLLLCVIYFRDALHGGRFRVLLLGAIPAALIAALLVRPAGLPFVAAIVLAAAVAAFRNRQDGTQMMRAVAPAVLVLIAFGFSLIIFGASTKSHLVNGLRGIAGPDGSLITALPRLIATRAFDELINIDVLLAWYPLENWQAVLLVSMIVLGAAAYVLLLGEVVAPLFLLTYTGFLLLIPWQQGFRFQLPMVSIMLLFLVSPLALFADAWRRRARRAGALTGFAAVTLFLMVLGTAMAQRTYDMRTFNDDETSNPRSQALLAWLKHNTEPSDRLCSFAPRAIMYFTARKTCFLPPEPKLEIGAYLESQGAAYAILIVRPGFGYRPLKQRLGANAAFTEVFRNEDYVVYKR